VLPTLTARRIAYGLTAAALSVVLIFSGVSIVIGVGNGDEIHALEDFFAPARAGVS
jgi:hypothetical protein